MADLLVESFYKEIRDLTGYLIEESLVDSQNMPARRERGNNIVVLQSSYWDAAELPRLQRNVDYGILYAQLVETGSYDLRFLDGGLVQMQYEFAADTGDLRRSRTAFLPAPDLTPFQEQPDLYLLDEVYGDVIDRRVVSVPVRIDFDSRLEVARDLHHPKSHLTLGQYPLCRLPIVSAVTPWFFLEMILRSFYRTVDWLCTEHMPGPRVTMPRTITAREASYVHVSLPLRD